MPQATYRGLIRRPPEIVFAFVADAEHNPRWHAHVIETRWIDPGPMRLGRRGRQRGHLWGRDWTFVAAIAEWDPPRAVTFQVIEGTRIRTAIVVEPAEGGSLVTLTVTTPRILGRRVDAFLGHVLKLVTRSRENGDFRRLREALEAERPGA